MTQEKTPYTVTAHTTDPAAANLILAAVIDEARRTGAQVNIGGTVPAPNGTVVNVKAAQGDQLADAASLFLTWAEAAEKPRLMHTPADVWRGDPVRCACHWPVQCGLPLHRTFNRENRQTRGSVSALL